MNCWDILQLEPDSDARAIKQGYAKKLKTTKPDEDPEGFKVLNSAYKQALKIARSQGAKSNISEVQPTTNRHFVERDEPISVTSTDPDDIVAEADQHDTFELPSELYSEKPESYFLGSASFNEIVESVYEPPFDYDQTAFVDSYSYEYIEKVEESCSEDAELDLVESIELLLSDKSRLNNVSEWEQLLKSPALYEISYRSWFTLKLFQMVCDHQWAVASKESVANKKISRAVLHFLNDSFLWTKQTDRLEEHFGYKEVEHFKYWLLSPKDKFLTKYTCEKEHQGEVEAGSLGGRIVAYFIDLVILLGISYLGGQLNALLPSSVFLSSITGKEVFLVLLILLFPLMEASRFQGSPGKMYFGLKVVNVEGYRLSFIHALGRQIAFILTMIFYKITVWINLFGCRDHRPLLQDRMSFSRVIKRN